MKSRTLNLQTRKTGVLATHEPSQPRYMSPVKRHALCMLHMVRRSVLCCTRVAACVGLPSRSHQRRAQVRNFGRPARPWPRNGQPRRPTDAPLRRSDVLAHPAEALAIALAADDGAHENLNGTHASLLALAAAFSGREIQEPERPARAPHNFYVSLRAQRKLRPDQSAPAPISCISRRRAQRRVQAQQCTSTVLWRKSRLHNAEPRFQDRDLFCLGSPPPGSSTVIGALQLDARA